MRAAIKYYTRGTGFSLSGVLRSAQPSFAAAGIEDGALEAELLLAHALGISRTQLFAALDAPLTAEQHTAFTEFATRRMAREPLPYIIGHHEFYGIDLLCTSDALIPRPESELLVDQALEYLMRLPSPLGRGAGGEGRIFDVGTGTGAIAIAIAAHVPGARVIATDTSAKALSLAAQNARRAGVDERIEFVHGSLLTPLHHASVIVANLPYICDDVYAAMPPELHREPESALRAGPRGTEVIESLLEQSVATLAPGGLLLAEHAWDQGAALRSVAAALFPNATIETKRDLAGLERVLAVTVPIDG